MEEAGATGGKIARCVLALRCRTQDGLNLLETRALVGKPEQRERRLRGALSRAPLRGRVEARPGAPVPDSGRAELVRDARLGWGSRSSGREDCAVRSRAPLRGRVEARPGAPVPDSGRAELARDARLGRRSPSNGSEDCAVRSLVRHCGGEWRRVLARRCRTQDGLSLLETRALVGEAGATGGKIARCVLALRCRTQDGLNLLETRALAGEAPAAGEKIARCVLARYCEGESEARPGASVPDSGTG